VVFAALLPRTVGAHVRERGVRDAQVDHDAAVHQDNKRAQHNVEHLEVLQRALAGDLPDGGLDEGV
jgi:hypothetical protein